LSGKEELSVNEILSIMEKQLGKTANIVNVGERLGDQQRTVDVSSKALRQIGYNPGTNISKGIAEQIKWQRELLQ
jgi:UDP-glucuronate 4-epimerase